MNHEFSGYGSKVPNYNSEMWFCLEVASGSMLCNITNKPLNNGWVMIIQMNIAN